MLSPGSTVIHKERGVTVSANYFCCYLVEFIISFEAIICAFPNKVLRFGFGRIPITDSHVVPNYLASVEEDILVTLSMKTMLIMNYSSIYTYL